MQLAETASERALAEEVRAFLAREGLRFAELPRALDDRMEVLRGWQAACHAAGYVGRAWPAEFGGGGRPPVEQIVVDQELAAAGAPEFVNVVGLDVLGPSLLRFGTDEQRRRYIPPILSARGDLVSGLLRARGRLRPRLRCARARRATTTLRPQRPEDVGVVGPVRALVRGAGAHRRRPSPRHRGISMLIVDMRSPGVEVRPMTQITGHAEFCELFLDDVVVPKENLLGELGDGWKIAMHTLGHERGTAALPRQVKLRTWLDRAVRSRPRASSTAARCSTTRRSRSALARALIGIEVLRHHAYRTVGEFLNGGAVGPDSSSVKLLMAEAEQALRRHGARGAADRRCQHADPVDDAENDFWYETYLYSRAASVYGGTRQIQRNIIADRVLALPKE